MRVKQAVGRVLLFVLGATFVWTDTGHAYLDPGSGSYVFQMIIAGLVGGLFAIKMSWVKIKASIKRFFAKGS